MSANGRGNMRPQSRSPPFLITGLVVALVILGANYWNMSSNNASLSAEVADLQDQIRILASKKNNYERKSDNAMLRIRDIEKNVNSKDQEVKSLKIELKELGSAKDACTNKLTQNEDNLNGLQQELATYKEKLGKYESEVKKEENSPNCDNICKEKTRELFALMEKLNYHQALLGLSQNGVDILDFKDKIGAKEGSLNQTGLSQGGQQKQQQQSQQQQKDQQQQGPSMGSGPVQQQQQQQGPGSQQSLQKPAVGLSAGSGTVQPVDVSNQVEGNKNLSGVIMYSSKNKSQNVDFKPKDALAEAGVKNVLPSAKIRLMNAGRSVVEMDENKRNESIGKQETGKQEEAKKRKNVGTGNKYDDVEDDDQYVDEKDPKGQLDSPKKEVKGQEKPMEDPDADYQDEEDDPAQKLEIKHRKLENKIDSLQENGN
ncbi:protein GOLM2 isoform X2 [Magallana gigas]|uniref:protein GOLM2 isoform X2 n=1 Tax=Magallana gigas TaxID=29159 RepID=UPI00333E8E1C